MDGRHLLATGGPRTSARISRLTNWLPLLAAILILPGCPSPPAEPASEKVEQDSIASPAATGQIVMRVRLSGADNKASVAVTGPLRIVGDDDQPLSRELANLPKSAVSISPQGAWRVGPHEFHARSVELLPARNGTLLVNDRGYKGYLRLVRAAGGFQVVNCLAMEDYVAGVVTAEMHAHYPIEALKAQAIIARTYAAWEKSNATSSLFDVVDTVGSQVYGGMERDRGVGRQAADATRGVMLVYGPPGRERIFGTFYHSTCGGGTLPIRFFKPKVEQIPPLAGGVACQWCRDTAWSSWPTVSIPRSEAWAKLRSGYDSRLPANGRDVRIVTDQQDQFGRILTVRLENDQWSRPIVLNATDLRLALGPSRVRSMMVEMQDAGDQLVFRNGRGFGHGAGLCQVGAAGLARQGATAGQILRHYYPQAGLKRAY